MVDWEAGSYETTAAELEPVAKAVVQQAAPSPGDVVLDLACGTGNAALLAAARGAQVVAVDNAPRLLEITRDRARAHGVSLDVREGDLLQLPVQDDAVDIVVSVFGVVFASEPERALREVARVGRRGSRVLITAWVPSGPIDAMLGALGRIVRRLTEAPAPQRFAWFDSGAVREIAAPAGLALKSTTPGELAIRDSSPEAYIAAGGQHPVSIAIRPVLERGDAEREATAAMTAVLRAANEDPGGFLVHSPYVVHELRVG
jgi:SAM-dependent methyltransferase